MSNPLSDVLPSLGFWRANWQSLLLGLVLFMGVVGLCFSGLVWVVLFAMEYRKHRTAWAARRNTQQFFKENIMAPGIAYLLLIPIFGAAYWPYEIESKNATAEKELKDSLKKTGQQRDSAVQENTTLKATQEHRRNVPDFNEPYFMNVIGGFRTFMTYRRAIGTGSCMFLITAPPDSADVERVLMYIGVFGANCPNGNLQNIGLTPEQSEAVYLNGVPDGVVVFHAPSTWQGATELMDSLNGLVDIRRDYHLPKDAPENYIWFQIGHKVKFKSQTQ